MPVFLLKARKAFWSAENSFSILAWHWWRWAAGLGFGWIWALAWAPARLTPPPPFAYFVVALIVYSSHATRIETWHIASNQQ